MQLFDLLLKQEHSAILVFFPNLAIRLQIKNIGVPNEIL